MADTPADPSFAFVAAFWRQNPVTLRVDKKAPKRIRSWKMAEAGGPGGLERMTGDGGKRKREENHMGRLSLSAVRPPGGSLIPRPQQKNVASSLDARTPLANRASLINTKATSGLKTPTMTGRASLAGTCRGPLTTRPAKQPKMSLNAVGMTPLIPSTSHNSKIVKPRPSAVSNAALRRPPNDLFKEEDTATTADKQPQCKEATSAKTQELEAAWQKKFDDMRQQLEAQLQAKDNELQRMLENSGPSKEDLPAENVKVQPELNDKGLEADVARTKEQQQAMAEMEAKYEGQLREAHQNLVRAEEAAREASLAKDSQLNGAEAKMRMFEETFCIALDILKEMVTSARLASGKPGRGTAEVRPEIKEPKLDLSMIAECNEQEQGGEVKPTTEEAQEEAFQKDLGVPMLEEDSLDLREEMIAVAANGAGAEDSAW